MAFLPDRTTIGAKVEDTPYTAETLTAVDYNFQAYNIKVDPDVVMMARKVARGDFGKELSIAGKQGCPISFSVDVGYSGTLQTAPTFGKLLKACGLYEEAHGVTGISYESHADYTEAYPLTMEVVLKDEGAEPVQIVVTVRGCMGNVKWICDVVGQPVRMDFEFNGALVSIADRAFASILVPTGMTDETPEAVLSASIMAFTTESQQVDKFTIDLGNDVQLFTDPAQAEGYEGAHVVTRNPVAELDPDLELIATHGDWARWIGNTPGVLSIQVGTYWTLYGPAAQLIKAYSFGDREGHIVSNNSFEFKRSSGNDSLKFLQGSES